MSTSISIPGHSNNTSLILDSTNATITPNHEEVKAVTSTEYSYDDTFGSCPLNNDGTGMCYIQCLFVVNPEFGVNINTADDKNIVTPDGIVSLNDILASYSETQKRYLELTTQLGIETLYNIAGSVDQSGNLLDIQLQHTFPSVADAMLAWGNITNNTTVGGELLLPPNLMSLYLMADLSFTNPDPSLNNAAWKRTINGVDKPLLNGNHITLHNFGPSGETEFFDRFGFLNAAYTRLLKNSDNDLLFRRSFGLGDVINGNHRKNLGSARQSLARQPGPLNTRKDIPQQTLEADDKWSATFWDWTSSLNDILTKLGLTGLKIKDNTSLLTFS